MHQQATSFNPQFFISSTLELGLHAKRDCTEQTNLKKRVCCQERAECSRTLDPEAQVLEQQVRQLATRALAAHGERKLVQKIVAHFSEAARRCLSKR